MRVMNLETKFDRISMTEEEYKESKEHLLHLKQVHTDALYALSNRNNTYPYIRSTSDNYYIHIPSHWTSDYRRIEETNEIIADYNRRISNLEDDYLSKDVLIKQIIRARIGLFLSIFAVTILINFNFIS